MKLLEQPCLFVDGQTTGMRPPQGQLLEFGYCYSSAQDLPPVVCSQVFDLEGEQKLQKKISEITGLTREEIRGRPEPKPWFKDVFLPWLEQHQPTLAVIHCAQFELPFLREMTEISFQVLCTQQLTRRLFPTLPSQNIRAVAGYFGHPISGPNRAGDFTLATAAIWSGIASKLAENGIHTLEELKHWLETEPKEKPKKKSISYRIPTELRLGLPAQPGIYKMFSKDGRILYVGKATSLKDRVNSYFRGVKNRDRRKLEMLAQVWDLKVEVCGSPLEAALRETDEIKRFDPPYNVTFKKNQRKLVFYSDDFSVRSETQDEICPRGPFRPGNWIDMVSVLHRSLRQESFDQIFYDPIEPEIMKAGFDLFLQRHNLTLESFPSIRSLLAYGSKLHRLYREPEQLEEAGEAEIEEEEIEVTPDYVAGKFERLLRRAGTELARTRKLTGLLNSEVEFKWGTQLRRILIRHGMIHTDNSPTQQDKNVQNNFPWCGLDIEAYDRINVLLSELNRLEHRILRHSPK